MPPIRPDERVTAHAHVVAAEPIDGAKDFRLIHQGPIITQVINEAGAIEERRENFLVFGKGRFVGHRETRAQLNGGIVNARGNSTNVSTGYSCVPSVSDSSMRLER